MWNFLLSLCLNIVLEPGISTEGLSTFVFVDMHTDQGTFWCCQLSSEQDPVFGEVHLFPKVDKILCWLLKGYFDNDFYSYTVEKMEEYRHW